MRLYFLALSLALFQLSCSKDSSDSKPTSEPIYIGEYTLLNTSLEKFPYTDKSMATYADSLGNTITLSIYEHPLFMSRGTLYRYDVFMEGDTVMYSYEAEYKSARLFNDDLDLSFQTRLHARPFYSDPESRTVADVLEIFLKDPDKPNSASQVFNHLVDKRTWPISSGSSAALLPTYTIHGVTYDSVFHVDYYEPLSEVYLNYAQGIVSFTDFNGVTFHLVKLE